MNFFKNLLRDSAPYISFRALWRWSRRLERWEPYQIWRMRRFYTQLIRPGDLTFDVGANMGSRTRVFLDLGASVVAVEPQKECARGLFIKFHANPRFHLVLKAVGAAEGTGEMYLSNSTRTSSLSQEWIAAPKPQSHQRITWGEQRQVPLTTLDALIREYGLPAFVKIDAEGYEYEIMRGLTHALPAFSLEFLPCFLGPALESIAYLKQLGQYTLNYAVEERFAWMLDEWVSPDAMIAILKERESSLRHTHGDVYARREIC